jgi:hypothetical protein
MRRVVALFLTSDPEIQSIAQGLRKTCPAGMHAPMRLPK